jgi:leucyl-tRNA synthetase
MAEAKAAIIAWFEEQGGGVGTVNFRLRDWLISRQRYWGCPIPMVTCPVDGLVPVPREQLPVIHPDVEDYAPAGRRRWPRSNPSSNVTCPVCGGPASGRRTRWTPSSTPRGTSCATATPATARRSSIPPKVDYWMEVDQYVGGVEHAVLHLLYARFITKVLHDMGMVEARSRSGHSSPRACSSRTGRRCPSRRATSCRPRLLRTVRRRRDSALRAVHRAAHRRRRLVRQRGRGDLAIPRPDLAHGHRRGRHDRGSRTGDADREVLAEAHRMVKKVTEDIDRFSFNTAVAHLMTFANTLQAGLRDGLAAEVHTRGGSTGAAAAVPDGSHTSATNCGNGSGSGRCSPPRRGRSGIRTRGP